MMAKKKAAKKPAKKAAKKTSKKKQGTSLQSFRKSVTRRGSVESRPFFWSMRGNPEAVSCGGCTTRR